MAETLFQDIGKQPGLEIWRVEDLYGSFHSGDSYIVLHTEQLKSGKLEWNVHFWLGKDSTQDEMGAAAIFSVQLDDSLGGAPVQHREVEGHESQQFLSYFKSGVRYLSGGVKSGFKTVEDEVVKRLFQVKGRRNVRVFEVTLDVSSMNKGDCFILDSEPNIFVWVGEKSGRMERIKAIQAATGIRDNLHGGRSSIKILDEFASGGDLSTFFEELGSGSADDVKDAPEVPDDSEFERSSQKVFTLEKVSDEDGDVKTELIGERPLKQEFLQHDSAFILDTGLSGLFVWVGKEASPKERSESMVLAQKYLTKKNYPNWVSIKRIPDGGETPLFKQYFSSWQEPVVGVGRVFNEKELAVLSNEPAINVAALHSRKYLRNCGKAVTFMPDDGSGETEVSRVENFELAPVDPSIHGFFFGGDSYVIKYSYKKEGLQRYIIYFWQGQKSTNDEKAASAIWAVRLDNDLAGKAVQVRVTQNHEPAHFSKIFKGKMVIFMGGHASGFKNVHDHDTYDVDGTRLFHVKGTSADNVRAVQVAEVAASLASEDVFVLETPAATYLWIGEASSEDELAMGKQTAEMVSPGRTLVEIKEGEEPDDFWNALGGKGDYQKGVPTAGKPLLSSRLFKCSDQSGRFLVEEICKFEQKDLSEDDVMILDSGEEVFIWVGKGASDAEKEQSFKLAEEYVRTDPTDRNVDDTVLIKVKQAEEPVGFTALFPDWDPGLWQ